MGTYHLGEIDFGFSLTYSNQFSADASGGILSTADSPNFEFTSGIDWIKAIQAFFFFSIPAPIAETAIDVLGLDDPNLPDFDIGSFLAKMFPTSSMLKGTSKLVFRYSGVTVDLERGIRAYGNGIPIEARTPRISIVGNLSIFYPDYLATYQIVPSSSPNLVALKLKYVAVTEDLRGQRRFQWTVDGVRRNEQGNMIEVKWEFDPHRPRTRTIGCTATDEDTLMASDFVTVHFMAQDRARPETPPKRIPFRESESGANPAWWE